MTATLSPTLVQPTQVVSSTTKTVLRAGVTAGVVGAVAATLVAGVAELANVPMEAAEKSAAVGEHIPLYGYAIGTLMATAVGLVLAVALRRWATRPARTWTVVAVALTAASFALPHTTGHATTATRLVLDLTHIAAALVIVPAIADRLPRRNAR